MSDRKATIALGIFCWLTAGTLLLPVDWPYNWKFSGFLVRLLGTIAGVAAIVETHPKRWKTEQQQSAALLVQEREYLKQEKNAIATEWKLVEEQISLAEDRLKEQTEFVRQQFEQEWEGRERELLTELEMTETQRLQLLQRCAELDAPKYPKGTSRIEWVATQLMDVLIENDILADYRDSHALPGADLIWVVPRTGVKVRKLRDVAEEMQVRLALEAPPSVEIEEGAVRFELRVDEARTKARKATQKVEIIEPPKDYFQRMIAETIHLFVNGDTGAGKSTLIANFVGLVQQTLGSDCEIVIVDPKFPHSDWVLQGEKIRPQFIGFDRLTDEAGNEYPCALDGLRQLDKDVRDRLAADAKDELAGRSRKTHVKRIYVVDEFEELVAEYGEEASAPVRSAWRLARSSNISVVAIGQNPGCKAYRLEKANLRNAACIYLRENALKGIDEVAPTAAQKKILKEQVGYRQLLADSSSNARFFGLIKYPGKSAFVAAMPKPGEYCGVEDGVVAVESEVTPELDIYDLIEEEMENE